eukprot:CAMPEP_0172521192 /NCGR_PEP_ID=MMETSP1066-20121228/292437_1 /TAXON_ID=671091 /ORGANISM="Coscinodiscus wailesii, Strain CCMP2513" /LENGTH=150 /DNA_ID=CAMNT_0013304069 /DNA_START=858 /DNA_END=1310 /DNA_ORIENTATION=+
MDAIDMTINDCVLFSCNVRLAQITPIPDDPANVNLAQPADELNRHSQMADTTVLTTNGSDPSPPHHCCSPAVVLTLDKRNQDANTPSSDKIPPLDIVSDDSVSLSYSSDPSASSKLLVEIDATVSQYPPTVSPVSQTTYKPNHESSQNTD